MGDSFYRNGGGTAIRAHRGATSGLLYRTLPQIGRFLTPQWRRQTADGSLQQTRGGEAFPTESAAVCRLRWNDEKTTLQFDC